MRCASCQRFVSLATARECIEYGDYGVVYSVEYFCPECYDPAPPPLGPWQHGLPVDEQLHPGTPGGI